MAKRTVYLSAGRHQVYQSLKCLSGIATCENADFSAGSSAGTRRSVFLRLGPVHSQERLNKKTAHVCSTGPEDMFHMDVFDRLSELSTCQESMITKLTFDTSASTPRCVRLQNKRISQLAVSEGCDQESSVIVEDLRQKLNRLKKTKEERKTLDRHLSHMIKFEQHKKPTTEHVSRVFPLRSLMDNSTEKKVKHSVTGTIDESVSKRKVTTPKKLVWKDRIGDEPNPPRLRQSAGVHLSSGGPHWQAKAALRHEEFRRVQKWNLLEKRRRIRHLVNTVGSDDTRRTPCDPVISREAFSRKRQAPSIDHLVTPSKRPRRTG
ncbi:uncharacterized protein LOC135471403 [Liolophura sinensis]|uniref:uncharacterized protein LOC135471403 n=1 Tax=Liolophura sinensis TaxID=3198878 RepID=UPI0031595E08